MATELPAPQDVASSIVPYYQAEEAVRTIIRYIGEDPQRSGLLETPGRVVRAMVEMTAGQRQDPKQILSKVFDEKCDEMVVLRGVRFTSLCEHHLLPFDGIANVGYLPGKVVGLSKMARLVECFARRLQIQERMTQQIAYALEEHLQARGAGCVIRAKHACMGCRGIKKPEAEMVTSCLTGLFRDEDKARAEFMALCRS